MKPTDLLAELNKVGIHPKLVYHPGAQKETGDWSGDKLTATVNDMAAFNNYLTAYNNTNKSNLPVFTEYLLEGSDFGKSYYTMNELRKMVNSYSALGSDTERWFTGECSQGVTLAPSCHASSSEVCKAAGWTCDLDGDSHCSTNADLNGGVAWPWCWLFGKNCDVQRRPNRERSTWANEGRRAV